MHHQCSRNEEYIQVTVSVVITKLKVVDEAESFHIYEVIAPLILSFPLDWVVSPFLRYGLAHHWYERRQVCRLSRQDFQTVQTIRPISFWCSFLKLRYSARCSLPKLTWDESVKRDLKDWNISKEIGLDRSAWRLAINVPEPWTYFFRVSSLAYPNLLGKKGYVVLVVYNILN